MGHVTQTKIEKTYDRYEYWLEKRTAVIKWQDRLRSIIDGTAPKIARRFHFRSVPSEKTKRGPHASPSSGAAVSPPV